MQTNERIYKMSDSNAIKVVVFSDYVWPFCYMAKSSLDKAMQNVELTVEWKAFELRPGGSRPDPSYAKMIESRWPQTIQMGRQYGVEMRTHTLGIDTRPAHQALKIVQEMAPAKTDAFNVAIFEAYFQDDADIGQIEVLTNLANQLGVDGQALESRMNAQERLQHVLDDEDFAFQNGISGVPAFIFMDKYLLSGVRSPEQLVGIVQQIKQQEGMI